MDHTGLSRVRRRVDEAAAVAGRTDPITLVAVTKYASDGAVAAVVEEGATALGESRATSLAERSQVFPGVDWHFIGHLQRNKVRRVRPVTSLLHSMDRESLARSWAGSDAPPVLLQVDLAGEAQKGGVAPDEAPALVETCLRQGIEVRGLMAIPPPPEHPGDSARWFTALRELRDRLSLDHPEVAELSMGMSDDFEVAVGEGATILRVGRAIFEQSAEED